MTRTMWYLQKLKKSVIEIRAYFNKQIKKILYTVALATVSAIGLLSAGVLAAILFENHLELKHSPKIVKQAESVASAPTVQIKMKSPAFAFAEQAVFKVLAGEGPSKFQQAGGTGFLMDTGTLGLVIVTNKHVCQVAGDSGIRVILVQGNAVYASTIRRRSRLTDICLIDVPKQISDQAKGYRAAAKPDIYYKTGTELYLFGHPKLMPLAMVHGKFRNYTQEYYEPDLPTTRGFGRADMDVYPGNSGSPVVNDSNELVGLLFAYEVFPDQPRAALFIPIAHVLDLINGSE